MDDDNVGLQFTSWIPLNRSIININTKRRRHMTLPELLIKAIFVPLDTFRKLTQFGTFIVGFSIIWLQVASIFAQTVIPAPDRREGEGIGPFDTLVIQGAIVIDGTGAPPFGPTNIEIKQNRIVRVGGPLPRDTNHVIDARGMYVMPGFIDMHAHLGTPTKAPECEYVYKLWMAHGVTTVRGVPLGDNDLSLSEKKRSEQNQIVAPRIFNYQRPPGNLTTPVAAREWIQQATLRGIEGIKLGSYRPEIMQALLQESKRHGMGSTAHLGQMGVAQMNAIDAARLGLDTVTHFYGHFEALLKDYQIQPWPVELNYNDEQLRFAQVARLWDKIHPPGSDEWNAYLKEHLELGTVFDPTLTIYSASRDVMRARTAEWHDKYTDPTLWHFFQPSRRAHGSYWFDWTTADEIAWRNFYQVWFRLIDDYKKMGGRITTGADSGFIYDTYGFAYIEELEMLQEAGLHPLEVIQCATYNGALTLHEPKGMPIEFGVVREGLLADLVIVPENPLANFKVLFGTGAVRLNNDTDRAERVGGVRWTIKDGIVYDARRLLEDVANIVSRKKSAWTSSQQIWNSTPLVNQEPTEAADDGSLPDDRRSPTTQGRPTPTPEQDPRRQSKFYDWQLGELTRKFQ